MELAISKNLYDEYYSKTNVSSSNFRLKEAVYWKINSDDKYMLVKFNVCELWINAVVSTYKLDRKTMKKMLEIIVTNIKNKYNEVCAVYIGVLEDREMFLEEFIDIGFISELKLDNYCKIKSKVYSLIILRYDIL